MRRAGLDRVEIGTGSGDVTLDLDQMGDGDYNVGTGSGDITLTMPPGTPVDVHAETNSGRIEVEVLDAEFRTREDDEVRFSVGGGGVDVELGTGGGDIRIRG